MEIKDYQVCENEVLRRYQKLKTEMSRNESLICNHIGLFNSNILTSGISLINNSLVGNNESKSLRKRLSYLFIECVQNIIFHSDNFPDDSQLAFCTVSKNKEGYKINACNTLKNGLAEELEIKIDGLLNEKEGKLNDLFNTKIKEHIDKGSGHGGLGLITILSKSHKNLSYTVTQITPSCALFQIQINLNLKDYKNEKSH